jgi:uncharacterized damage-inducible protein DinB
MAETPQEYIKRILANVEGKNPLVVQQATSRRLADLIARLDKRKLRRRPAPERWSIAEILAHLADTELVAGWRLRQILSQNGATIQAFDQDVWAGTFQYAHRDPRESLEMFSVLRKNNLTMLKSMPQTLWENYGMHQERGKESVAHMVRMFAGHDLNHLKQIEQMAKPSRKH